MPAGPESDGAARVSAAILSFNRRDKLAFSLEKMAGDPGLEIVVFENGSSDGSAAMVRERFPNVRLLESETNLGIEGYNRAVEAATGDIVLVLDDDSYVEPDVPARVRERFAQDPSIGALAFQIFLQDGRSVTATWPEEVPSFWGCGAAIRRDLWLKLGGYDKDLFLYLNEIDLAMRIWNAGHRVVYDPACRAHHLVDKQNRASGRLLNYSARNVILYQLKNVPRRRLPRTLAADLLSYFSLSLLARRPGAYFQGLLTGWKDRRLALARRQPVSDAVIDFYLRSTFMWQWPLRQWRMKRGLKALNTDPRDV